MSKPLNKALYAKVKREAKKKFKVWPSAYASAWLVRTYKKRGGKYSGRKNSNKKRPKRRKSPKKRRRSPVRRRRRRRSRFGINNLNYFGNYYNYLL